MILKHLCLSGKFDIIQTKITWFWGYILLPLSCSMSLNSSIFDVKSIIFSQFWWGAFSQSCWKKPWTGSLTLKLAICQNNKIYSSSSGQVCSDQRQDIVGSFTKLVHFFAKSHFSMMEITAIWCNRQKTSYTIFNEKLFDVTYQKLVLVFVKITNSKTPFMHIR